MRSSWRPPSARVGEELADRRNEAPGARPAEARVAHRAAHADGVQAAAARDVHVGLAVAAEVRAFREISDRHAYGLREQLDMPRSFGDRRRAVRDREVLRGIAGI